MLKFLLYLKLKIWLEFLFSPSDKRGYSVHSMSTLLNVLIKKTGSQKIDIAQILLDDG
jgi:hypothetical protein